MSTRPAGRMRLKLIAVALLSAAALITLRPTLGRTEKAAPWYLVEWVDDDHFICHTSISCTRTPTGPACCQVF